MRRLVLAAIALLAACSAGEGPEPPPAAPVLPPGEGLRVVLAWNATADLDLYLTDPTSETAYFANTPTRSGARIERDLRCGEIPSGASAAEVARAAPAREGRYRIGVDFIDACGARAAPVSFRIVAEIDGQQASLTGTALFQEFQPVVLEIDLTRTAQGGWILTRATQADASEAP